MSGWDQLLSALDETSRALAAGDAPGAAASMQVVERAREELRASGAPLDAATLSQARELLERCNVAAAQMQARLEEEMARAGHGRRAAAAYGRPPRR